MRNLNTIINKSDKYLVKLLSQNKDKKTSTVIKDSAGKPFHYFPDFQNVFRTFYKHLYTSDHDPIWKTFTNF